MKLYEINSEILRLTDAIDFDPETDEILGNTDDLFNEINKLKIQKKYILVWLAKIVLNLRSEEAALKAEDLANYKPTFAWEIKTAITEAN